MSDSLGVNPMYVDTASATAKSLPFGTSQKLLIKKIVWVAPVTDDDDCTVQDSSGNEIYKFSPAVATFNQEANFGSQGLLVTGLLVPTLDSGHLLIFLR